ncbi:DUF397 domain-containing protein [Actinomadura syzygii]|uniref:DUF397 domain-containing protein n=1 Tax=Actinomadura syzygii TaxID=1427538 RepID=A0A5D0UG21_9ACTN|nr:DUF397 domain-containing protein [Actinomadura syzygii]TYC17441.1 DUF397 domain-containing protein [Actinomadura syzygii]
MFVEERHLTWRKSTRSNSSPAECVEVAALPTQVAIRDSKDPSGPRLILSAETWRSFTAQARAGAYDA